MSYRQMLLDHLERNAPGLLLKLTRSGDLEPFLEIQINAAIEARDWSLGADPTLDQRLHAEELARGALFDYSRE